jgi:hypothetical protein
MKISKMPDFASHGMRGLRLIKPGAAVENSSGLSMLFFVIK